MTHEATLAAADRIRVIVLAHEDKVIPERMGRIPPHDVYRKSARGRRAWLDQAAVELARTQRMFGDD